MEAGESLYVHRKRLVLGRNRQDRTRGELEQPPRHTADQQADQLATSAGSYDDQISACVAGESSDRVSRTARRYFGRGEFGRNAIPLQALDLSSQGSGGSRQRSPERRHQRPEL